MRALEKILLLAALCIFSINSHSSDPNDYSPLVDSIVRAFDSSKKVLALGENSHNYSEQYLLLDQILKVIGPEIDFVGFEIESQHQEAINSFLNGNLTEIAQLNHRISSQETRTAFQNVLLTIKQLNANRLRPIKVLALDLSGSCCIMEGTNWFESRDPYMFETLLRETDHFSGRGILFLGAGHLMRNPMPTPKIAQKMMNVAAHIPTLGSFIEDYERLKGQVVRAWIDSPVLAVDAFSMVPPDWQITTSVGKRFSGREPFIISTAKNEFINAEKAAITRKAGPFRISENFDYFVRVKNEISLRQQCAAWLSPSKLMKGTIMRILSR